MVLIEKITFVWSICFLIPTIGVSSSDVINLTTNHTPTDGSSAEKTTNVGNVVPEKRLDSNAISCKTSEDCPEYINCRKNRDNDLRFCRCPFGLGGDKCNQTIDECKAVGLDCGNNPNVTCERNETGYAVCCCESLSEGFNYEIKDCVKCECGGHNLGCHFFPGGEKKCYCYGDTYQKDGKCEDCNCGNGSHGCSLQNGIKVCNCWGSYLQNNDTCEECDCGKNSDGCSFQNGQKTCSCKLDYIQYNGTCRRKCNWRLSDECKNGAKCKDSVCQCLSGTHGDFCEIVDLCEHLWQRRAKCGFLDNVDCAFNQTSRKTFCKCKLKTHIFNENYGLCIECDCGSHGTCSYNFGKKACECEKGYKVTPETSDKRQCKQCDCGSFGDCSFDKDGEKICTCQTGYVERKGLCVACSCGMYGECEWNENDEKTCKCQEGFGDRDGICRNCFCYWRDGDRSSYINCTFPYGEQKCTCPPGYEETTKTICSDIDECKDSNICSNTTECMNVQGSYRCNCKKGYKPFSNETDPKLYGCMDIDECEEQNECPYRDTSKCINTLGSYYCACKSGYYSKFSYSIANEGCLKDQRGWKIGYTLPIIVLAFVSLGIGFAIYRRHRCSSA